MNSQERTSGGFRREKRSIPKAWLHAAWLFGMTAALALGWLGTTWIRERVQETNSAAQMARLARLDAEAQEFLDQAHRAIPEIVFELTRFPNMFRLWQRLARDKLCGTQRAQEFLAQKLTRLTEPCRSIASIYGVEPAEVPFLQEVSSIAGDAGLASLSAVSGLGLELVFLRTTLHAVARVAGAAIGKLAFSWGAGAASALADGPFPFGDAVGVVMAVGGTAWSLIDLKRARTQLPPVLTAELEQRLQAFHEACRRSVSP